MNMKIAFAHRDLDKDIYIQYLEDKDKEELVCQLCKSFYSLKLAPTKKCNQFYHIMLSHRYKCNGINHFLYTKKGKNGSLVILILYVDNMLIASGHMEEI